jgi:hypothetical protein
MRWRTDRADRREEKQEIFSEWRRKGWLGASMSRGSYRYVNRMRADAENMLAANAAHPSEEMGRHPGCGIFISYFYGFHTDSAGSSLDTVEVRATVNRHLGRSMRMRTNEGRYRGPRCELYGCFEQCRSDISLRPGSWEKNFIRPLPEKSRCARQHPYERVWSK